MGMMMPKAIEATGQERHGSAEMGNDDLQLRETLGHPSIEPLRQQLRDSAVAPRARELRGAIEQGRKVLGSKPVFAGTRTPVEALFPYLQRRYNTERILKAFPHLSREDVQSARRQFRERGVA
jgi:uncharacterized protein (DUF433 family)